MWQSGLKPSEGSLVLICISCHLLNLLLLVHLQAILTVVVVVVGVVMVGVVGVVGEDRVCSAEVIVDHLPLLLLIVWLHVAIIWLWYVNTILNFINEHYLIYLLELSCLFYMTCATTIMFIVTSVDCLLLFWNCCYMVDRLTSTDTVQYLIDWVPLLSWAVIRIWCHVIQSTGLILYC